MEGSIANVRICLRPKGLNPEPHSATGLGRLMLAQSLLRVKWIIAIRYEGTSSVTRGDDKSDQQTYILSMECQSEQCLSQHTLL